jgi:hypothetical protein
MYEKKSLCRLNELDHLPSKERMEESLVMLVNSETFSKLLVLEEMKHQKSYLI